MKEERPMAFIPYPQVVETTPRGERSWDIFSRLLNDRKRGIWFASISQQYFNKIIKMFGGHVKNQGLC